MRTPDPLGKRHRRALLAALCVLAALALAAQAAGAEAPTTQPASGPAAGAAQAEQADGPAAIDIPWVWWIAPAGAIIALLFAWVFYRQVKGANEGDENMKQIAAHVRAGAYAYLKRQYKVVTVFFIVVCALLFVMGQIGAQHKIVFIAFLTGGFFSGLCGFLGMKTATMASNRTTQGAKESLNRGLTVAFRAGAVMGLVVVGFGLLNITVWFLILTELAPALGYRMSLLQVTSVMLVCGIGASSQALFARVGGGIFTKAADVGADLVGKVEAGIPEDDPRNPATIADNVGDNVGDVAGMGADLYESYCNSILATAALGVAAAAALGLGTAERVKLLAAPMVLAGVGIALSIIGIYLVRTRENASMKQLLGSLGRGVHGSSLLIVAAAWAVCYVLLRDVPGVDYWGIWGSIVAGLVAGVVIGKSAEYYTSCDYKPTKEIVSHAETGPATVIIAGIAEGMKSTWAAIMAVIIAIVLAYAFAGGFENMPMGLYGVGIAAVGMLATLGITLATDAYGPIADNAGGNAEMTHQPPEVRKRTDALDSLGNTTAAVGKGFAIGSAALTALALLAAYVEEIRVGQNRQAMTTVVRHVPEADDDPKAGLYQVFYIGHGKFAMKVKEGTSQEAFIAVMALTKLPEGLKPGPIEGCIRIIKMPLLGGGVSEQAPAAGAESRFVPADMDNLHTLILRRLNEDVAWVILPRAAEGPSPGRRSTEVLQYMPEVMLAEPVEGSEGHEAAFGEGLEEEETLAQVQLVSARDATLLQYMSFYNVTLLNPKVLCGLFAGVLLVFLFSSMTLKAVGRAANAMVKEVRRQFKEIPGIMEGTGKPDYARCVDISTAGAQREMIVPSLLALVVPVVTGLLLGVPGVLGLLAGGLTCGFALAIFMANAGGAWDNAKKYIETGQFGGKGSDRHKATVVGDTVGDPFKDTSGPSLNILIKLMSMVSVVFAGVIVKYAPQIAALLGLD